MKKRRSFNDAKTSWERIHTALWNAICNKKTNRLSYDKFNQCMTATPGLAFSEGTTCWDILSELQDQKRIKINPKYITVLPFSY